MSLPLFDGYDPEEAAVLDVRCNECLAIAPCHVPGCSYLREGPPRPLKSLDQRLDEAAAVWEFVGPLLREAAARIRELEAAEWRHEHHQWAAEVEAGRQRAAQP